MRKFDEWHIGDKIGDRWEVFDIKHGGQGIVFCLYDNILDLPLAAKTYPDEFSGGNAIAEQFIKEASIWIDLDFHPNIVQALQIHEFKGKPYVFLEYISGGSLANWVGTRRVIEDTGFTLRLTINLCDAMIHAATKGLRVHMDIKPHNCLVTEDEQLKLTDFGIARCFYEAAHEERSRRTDRKSSPAGTPAYMAPEQFGDPKSVDIRADIYGFGVTLFELVSGYLPFTGSSWEEYEHLHKTAPIPRLPLQYSFLAPLLSACLQKDRTARIGTFREIREMLSGFYQNLISAPQAIPLVSEVAHDKVEVLNEEVGESGGRIVRLRGYDTKRGTNYFMLPAEHFSNKAVSLRRLGRNEEALEACNLALRLKSDLLEAWINKSAILVHLGRYNEALACVDHVIEVAPEADKTWGAWGNRGFILHRMQNYSEAIENFNRAISLDRANARLWFGRGESLEQIDQCYLALESYREALRLDPNLHEAWTAKLRLLSSREAQGEMISTAEYVEAHEKSVETNPRSPSALINKGGLSFTQGNLNEALDFFNLALTIDPLEPEGWYNRALALKNLGRASEALASIDHALRLNPQLKDAWGVKGNLLLAQGRYGYAIACFDRAIELNPSDHVALNGRAMALAEQERK